MIERKGDECYTCKQPIDAEIKGKLAWHDLKNFCFGMIAGAISSWIMYLHGAVFDLMFWASFTTYACAASGFIAAYLRYFNECLPSSQVTRKFGRHDSAMLKICCVMLLARILLTVFLDVPITL